MQDVLAHRLVVGIDDVDAHVAVAGHVKLHDAIRRDAVEESQGIVAMVEG